MSISSQSKIGKRAHAAVAAAIRKGTLIRGSCETCGEPWGYAHHDDYKKPLEVRWLCPSCHMNFHEELKRKEHPGWHLCKCKRCVAKRKPEAVNQQSAGEHE